MSKLSETSLPLNEQLVLVTGAGRGLGAHIARAFLNSGTSVIVNYLNSASAAEQIASEAPGRALAIQAAVSYTHLTLPTNREV